MNIKSLFKEKISQAISYLKKEPEKNTPEISYSDAKTISKYLFAFPYIDPSTIDPIIKNDSTLMDIVVLGHKSTLDNNNRKCQSTLDPLDRIKYQQEFKNRIAALLDDCLLLDPNFAPAILLYVRAAEWNTRAGDRPRLITLYEKFLGCIESTTKGTRAYDLIAADIKGLGGNEYEKVERHLSDFHYELGKLYLKDKRLDAAQSHFERAELLTPSIYAGAVADVHIARKEYEKAIIALQQCLKLPIKKFTKDLIRGRCKEVKFLLKDAQRTKSKKC